MKEKDSTKEKILRAAIKLMNQYGFGGLSISELARQAKISKQSLFYHFKSPEEVLIVLAEEWGRTGQSCTLKALADTNETGAMKILAMSEGMFTLLKLDFELARLGLSIYQSSPHIKKLHPFMESVINTGRERIRSILVQDKAFSTLAKAKLEKVVTSFHSLLYGYYFYVVTLNDQENIESHKQNCNEALKRLIESFQE